MQDQSRFGQRESASLARERAGLALAVVVLVALALVAYTPAPAAASAPPPPALLTEPESGAMTSAQPNHSGGTPYDRCAQAEVPCKDGLSANSDPLSTRRYSAASVDVAAEAAFLAANPELLLMPRQKP